MPTKGCATPLSGLYWPELDVTPELASTRGPSILPGVDWHLTVGCGDWTTQHFIGSVVDVGISGIAKGGSFG